MWLKTHFYSGLLFCIVFTGAKSQTNPSAQDSAIVGVWKGSSICQVKNSPCHDETVVYHITKVQGVDMFDVDAYKIIDGKEDEMGILHFHLDKTKNQLIANMNGTWTLNLKGRNIDGILTVNGTLYRIIKLTKQT